MAAILHKEGVVVSQRPVDKKTNEITELKPLLDSLDLFFRFPKPGNFDDQLLIIKECSHVFAHEIDAKKEISRVGTKFSSALTLLSFLGLD